MGTKFRKRSQSGKSSEDHLISGNPSFKVLLKPTHISGRLVSFPLTNYYSINYEDQS